MITENTSVRYERYKKAKETMDLWRGKLDEMYDYYFPYRNDIFVTESEGQIDQNEIFDETGMISAHLFANNLQYVLMPPFQRWIELEAGDVIEGHAALSDDEREKINEKLQKDTDILFKYINSSNFALAMNEAYQDLCIGTGFLQIVEGDIDKPLHFYSIPLGKISVSEGYDGLLRNFWREWDIPVRDIKSKWPDVKLTNNLKSTLKNTPDEKVCLLEGCIYYPDNPIEKRYLYYLQPKEEQTDIVSRWMEMSPFIGFRYTKAPGQTLGIGVAQYAFPAVKVLNKMAELELKSFKFHAFPAYVDASGRSINPNTARIEPGALVVVSPDFATKSPIQPIPVGGSPQFAQLEMQIKQQTIREIMMVEPLGPVQQTPQKTATEISIRQQNYLRRNSSAASRLAVECIKPVVEKCLHILRKKGLITDIITTAGIFKISVNEKTVRLDYKSPLISLQDSQDVNRLMQWVNIVMSMYGQEGTMAAMERFKIPEWVADKMDIDLGLIKNDEEFEQDTKQIAQAQLMMRQQAAQQQGGQSA